MTLFQKVMHWFGRHARKGQKAQSNQKVTSHADVGLIKKFRCEHGPTTRRLKVTILGTEIEFKKSPMCQPCTEEYLNMCCTLCASCKQPTFPGMSVGEAWSDAPHPYTHLTYECCISGGLYCGRWGEGRLITLHELKPDTYPENTSSIAMHAAQTGEMVIENLRSSE